MTKENDFYMVLCTVNFKINIMSFGNEIANEVGKKILLPILIVFVVSFLIGFALGAWLL